MFYVSKLLKNLKVNTEQLEAIHAKLNSIVQHQHLQNFETANNVFLDELLYVPGANSSEWFCLDPFHKILDRDNQVL